MFLSGLDETDQQIVKLLIKNARMSYSDIGAVSYTHLDVYKRQGWFRGSAILRISR